MAKEGSLIGMVLALAKPVHVRDVMTDPHSDEFAFKAVTAAP